MYNSMLESELSGKTPEKRKVKKKMSKAQMQLAIIKKKQCDARALAIVEQLLEPNVDIEWLLSNLKDINKSHMEDVIEERAIIKLCGYVLCSNSLTVVITQQYHISTKKNKVYDVSRRKNFCSSRCYGACSYLLEQMLTSPLWLREKEEIPKFKLLPEKLQSYTPGEEVQVGGVEISVNAKHEKECAGSNNVPQSGEKISLSDSTLTANQSEERNPQQNQTLDSKGISNSIQLLVDVDVQSSETRKDSAVDVPTAAVIEKVNSEQCMIDNAIAKVVLTLENTILENTEVNRTGQLSNVVSVTEDVGQAREESKINASTVNDTGSYRKATSVTIKEQSEIITESTIPCKEDVKRKKHSKHKKDRTPIKSEKDLNTFYTLAMRIEQSVKEWMTEDTLCLLSGEESVKNRLLENVNQHDKYLQLYKKLNELQLEDERDDQTNIEKSTLKPLPHLSVLQEEGKKMELKVRAFYTGKMVIETPTSTTEETEKNNDSPAVMPLTDAHAPKALRRRIFLDKLHRTLPDLLRALGGAREFQAYIYTNERNTLIKALVNTFSLSATNIVFKTAEWTLVGLIIIKMLSVMDPRIKVLLATKQASMYISMILMSYKLDSNYLDRLIIELTNNPRIFDMDSNIHF